MLSKIKKSTWFGIAFIVIGVAFGIYAKLTSYVDEQGMLHESLSTPLSAFFLLLGVATVILSLILVKLKKKK